MPFVNAALTKRRATTVVEKPDISLSGNGLRFGGGVQCFLTHKLALDVGVQDTMGNFTHIEVAGVMSARFRYKVVRVGVRGEIFEGRVGVRGDILTEFVWYAVVASGTGSDSPVSHRLKQLQYCVDVPEALQFLAFQE